MGITLERRAELAAHFRRATEVPMLLVAIGFLITVALPEIIDLPDDVRLIQEEVEWVICALFAIELAINTYLASDRKRYLLAHWLDVVTVAVRFYARSASCGSWWLERGSGATLE
jgi:hypothetical protein